MYFACHHMASVLCPLPMSLAALTAIISKNASGYKTKYSELT